MKKNNPDIFSSTNTLRILSFMMENPGKEFLGSEIQKATRLSRAGIYIALRELIKLRLVRNIKKGKFLIYAVVYDDPVVKQFKVLKNVQALTPMIGKLKPVSDRVVLYGSSSRGEDDHSSDIDLFVLSKDPESVQRIVAGFKTKRAIQAVIKSPSELPEFKEKENVYFQEVDRGIIMWEAKE
jgi:predicted nucleotidyltransferase